METKQQLQINSRLVDQQNRIRYKDTTYQLHLDRNQPGMIVLVHVHNENDTVYSVTTETGSEIRYSKVHPEYLIRIKRLDDYTSKAGVNIGDEFVAKKIGAGYSFKAWGKDCVVYKPFCEELEQLRG